MDVCYPKPFLNQHTTGAEAASSSSPTTPRTTPWRVRRRTRRGGPSRHPPRVEHWDGEVDANGWICLEDLNMKITGDFTIELMKIGGFHHRTDEN